VDPELPAIEAFVLEQGRYILSLSASGGTPVDLPPFTALGLIPDALWP